MKLLCFALWAALIPGPFLALGRIPYGCSLASSVVLVLLAWLQAKEPQAEDRRLFARRIAIGMSFGLLGDLTMASGVLLGAMLVFGIGHFFYMRAMIGVAKPRWIPWAICVAAGAWIWYQMVLNGTSRTVEFKVVVGGALIYTLFLASMTGMAVGLASRQLAYLGLGVGGVLFLASDAVIAARVFNLEVYARFPEAIRNDLVWLTYAPAQLLIVASAGTHLRRGTVIA